VKKVERSVGCPSRSSRVKESPERPTSSNSATSPKMEGLVGRAASSIPPPDCGAVEEKATAHSRESRLTIFSLEESP
jgi:hypothetical protein